MTSLTTSPRPPITGLFAGSGPATVSRGVVPVVISTVNAEPWAVTVSKGPISEGIEIGPSFADTDTPASVIRPRFVVGVIAALSHAAPDIPKRGSCTPVSGRCSDGADFLLATARERISRTKIWEENCANHSSASALAVDEPAVSEVFSDDMDDCELSPDFSDIRCNRWVTSHRTDTITFKCNLERKVA